MALYCIGFGMAWAKISKLRPLFVQSFRACQGPNELSLGSKVAVSGGASLVIRSTRCQRKMEQQRKGKGGMRIH